MTDRCHACLACSPTVKAQGLLNHVRNLRRAYEVILGQFGVVTIGVRGTGSFRNQELAPNFDVHPQRYTSNLGIDKVALAVLGHLCVSECFPYLATHL